VAWFAGARDVAFGCGPAVAHTRQLKVLEWVLYPEGAATASGYFWFAFSASSPTDLPGNPAVSKYFVFPTSW
jgi:hypothetical protein